MTLDEFFAGHDLSRQLFDALQRAIDAIGPAELRVTKSQVAFRRRIAFAWTWRPGQYLRGKSAPLVLTLAFRRRDASPRWKEIVEPKPGRFTHHLELQSTDDIDAEGIDWLREGRVSARRVHSRFLAGMPVTPIVAPFAAEESDAPAKRFLQPQSARLFGMTAHRGGKNPTGLFTTPPDAVISNRARLWRA